MGTSSILLLTFAAFAAAAGQLLFKVGATDSREFLDFINIAIFSGLFLYGVSTAIWIYALSSEMLVNVYAFTALTFALVYAGGVLFLGETLTPAAVAGILLVLSGLYLITIHGN
jgi:drug/metabolite transporter (DMT)-like permease